MPRSSRAPYIAVRTDVVKDESFAMLGDIAGYSRDEAFGRLFRLWAFCRDRGLEDAPDDCRGYAVSEGVILRFLGPRGVEAILADGCDELALGERYGDGSIYLRGTSETVEALRGMLRSAEAGGRARASQRRGDGGRFTDTESVIQSHFDQPCGTGPVPDAQPTGTCQPPVPSVPPSSFLLPPEDPDSAAAPRAKPVKRPALLPEDWKPERSPANLAAEQQAGKRGVDLGLELQKLHDWARGENAKKADWNAMWRNWTRNARPSSNPGQRLLEVVQRVDETPRVRGMEDAS